MCPPKWAFGQMLRCLGWESRGHREVWRSGMSGVLPKEAASPGVL